MTSTGYIYGREHPIKNVLLKEKRWVELWGIQSKNSIGVGPGYPHVASGDCSYVSAADIFSRALANWPGCQPALWQVDLLKH